jgi:hypothetical protein
LNTILKQERICWSEVHMLRWATLSDTELEFLPGAKLGISRDIRVGSFEPDLGVGECTGGDGMALNRGAVNANT